MEMSPDAFASGDFLTKQVKKCKNILKNKKLFCIIQPFEHFLILEKEGYLR